MFTLLFLAAAPALLPPTVSDDACALDTAGLLRCIDLQDHCVSAPPKDVFRAFGTSEGTSGCGLKPDGTVSCWGSFAAAKVPADLGAVVQLSVAKPHACALRADKTVRCWGSSYEGSLDAPSGAFQSISVGHSVSCGVRVDGSLACWGWHAKAGLAPPKGAFQKVSVGLQAACALDAKGTMTCWGDLPIAPRGSWASVTVGSFVACAVRTDGTAACFGPDGAAKPIGPKGTRFSEVATRCGRLVGGQLVCWPRDRPEVLQVDDGLTRIADASGSCGPPPRAPTKTGPLPPRRPWVDEVMKQVRADTLDTESGRDLVQPGDLPHFAQEYRGLTKWSEKRQLINLLCDSHDPVLADMMWDALDVPDCTVGKGCKFADGWEVRATVLAYLDGDFARFTTYLNDEALTRKTIARRLEERRARFGR